MFAVADMSQIYRAMPRGTFLFLSALVACVPARAQSFLAPEPYGGNEAVKWFFEQELHFPAEALAANTEGATVIGFTVQADGSVIGMHVQQALRPDCDAEALRLAKLVRWHSASVGGSALDKEYSLTVPFSTKKYKKAHNKQNNEARNYAAIPADASGQLYEGRELDTLATPLIDRGLHGLPNYLGANLRYPEEAFRRDIQGTVTIEFVVENSGSVSNLRAVENLGGGCDEEAMRLIRSITWRPAFRKGQRARSVMKLDIQFRLDQNKRP